MQAYAPVAVMPGRRWAFAQRTSYHDQRGPGRQVQFLGLSVCGDDTERMLVCVSEAISDIRFAADMCTNRLAFFNSHHDARLILTRLIRKYNESASSPAERGLTRTRYFYPTGTAPHRLMFRVPVSIRRKAS